MNGNANHDADKNQNATIELLKGKIEALERFKRDGIIGAAFFSLFLVVFLGIQWQRLPGLVKEAMKDSAQTQTAQRLEALLLAAEADAAKLGKVTAAAQSFDLPQKVADVQGSMLLVRAIGQQGHKGPAISVTEGRAGWERVERCPEGHYVVGVGGRGGGGGKFCYNCVDVIKFECEPFFPAGSAAQAGSVSAGK